MGLYIHIYAKYELYRLCIHGFDSGWEWLTFGNIANKQIRRIEEERTKKKKIQHKKSKTKQIFFFIRYLPS